MVVELISVGTEILLGNIVNTNAAYLAEKCALLGCSLYHQTVVGDNEERMEEAIRQRLKFGLQPFRRNAFVRQQLSVFCIFFSFLLMNREILVHTLIIVLFF